MSSQSQITKSKSQQGTMSKSWWKCQTKEAELQRLQLLELWTAEYKMMLKLKLQFFGHLMQRVDSLEKTLMLGRIGGRRRRGRQRTRWLDGITDSMGSESEWTPGDGDGQGGLACCDSWGRKELDTTEQLNWIDLFVYFGNYFLVCYIIYKYFLSVYRLSFCFF